MRVAAFALLLDPQGCRDGGPYVVEIEKQPIAQALDQPTAARRQRSRLHILHKIEPTLDHPDLILLDEAD